MKNFEHEANILMNLIGNIMRRHKPRLSLYAFRLTPFALHFTLTY